MFPVLSFTKLISFIDYGVIIETTPQKKKKKRLIRLFSAFLFMSIKFILNNYGVFNAITWEFIGAIDSMVNLKKKKNQAMYCLPYKVLHKVFWFVKVLFNL